MIAVLEAVGVTKSYGGLHAVEGVSLDVRAGEIHAVIGPNGAGKSTLFGCLAGSVRPNTGRIMLDGIDVTRLSARRRAQRGLAKSFQTTAIFPTLSVAENVQIASLGPLSLAHFVQPLARCSSLGLVDSVLRKVGLWHRREAVADTLSHGEQRALELGIALACGGRILLLDEPTAGMGIDDIAGMKRLLAELRRDHGILLVEHNMSIVLGLSDRITVMQNGQVIARGTPRDIERNPVVRAAYLGGSPC